MKTAIQNCTVYHILSLRPDVIQRAPVATATVNANPGHDSSAHTSRFAAPSVVLQIIVEQSNVASEDYGTVHCLAPTVSELGIPPDTAGPWHSSHARELYDNRTEAESV